MSDYEFPTAGPIKLYAELGKGSLSVRAEETATTRVDVTGDGADEVRVTREGDQVSIIAPHTRTGFLGREPSLEVEVWMPVDSQVMAKTGSADVDLEGPVGAARVKTGSGDIGAELLGGPAELESGSGDVRVGTAGAQLRVKTGSGDIRIDHADEATAVSTGSGDTEVGSAQGPLAVKSGSGDLTLADGHDDISFSTGSGDLQIGTAHRGRLTAKGASGDFRVGVPEGLPVWTDIYTVTGEIRSDLIGAGQPADDDADRLEIRAKTVSGDIDLRQR
ncbi:MAG: DUF4097 family beta strand repeat-containing protein [Nocardioidaceae bacterium]